ncbi:MAG: BLUF domain-containing protein [Sphingomicrobium sp.]
MTFKSLTYTSFARLDLTGEDLTAIYRTARDLNALDGVTGLLIFNGTHFLQIVEGSRTAIDELVERLRRDRRHSGFEVRDERQIEVRSFPDWSMELARVTSSYFEARDSIAERLPPTVPIDVRDRLFAMTELISGTVEMPD